MTHKNQKQFMEMVVRLAPEDFLGLAKLLGVKLTYANLDTDEARVRDAEEILADVAVTYYKSPRRLRKQILKEMARTLEEDKHGPTTEH